MNPDLPAEPGSQNRSIRLLMKYLVPSVSIKRLLFVTGFVSFLLFWIVAPRERDARNARLFEEEGAVEGSWITRNQQNWIDKLLLFDGFVDSAYLLGEDAALNRQIQATAIFSRISSVDFYKVEAPIQLPLGYSTNARNVRFSYCSEAFIESILRFIPNARSIEFFECKDLTDTGLRDMQRLRNVESITIDGSSVTGAFAKCTYLRDSLRSLTVRYSPVSENGLVAISRLHGLEQLVLEFPTTNLDLHIAERELSTMPLIAKPLLTGFDERESRLSE